MKALWRMLAARIDALSLRERALIFWVLLLVGLILGDQLWLAPAQLKQRQLAADVKQQNSELQALRDQLGGSKAEPLAPNAPQRVRAELATLQGQIDQVNREISQLLRMGGESDPLPRVLLHILRRYEGLTLERTSTLVPEPVTKATQVGAEAAAAPSLLRHGMEFTVSGSYGELMRYVQTLEQELPGLRWGSMRLSNGRAGPQLTLQVYWLGGVP